MSWLEQVKADAVALTEQRLKNELPQLEREVKAQSRKKAEDLEPSQPVGGSDGRPDQGPIEEVDSSKKKGAK
jgi:hypothetical protein